MNNKMLGQLYMCAALGFMAENRMGSGGSYAGLPSYPHEKTPLAPHQKKRRKNAKIAKLSRKKNRRK